MDLKVILGTIGIVLLVHSLLHQRQKLIGNLFLNYMVEKHLFSIITIVFMMKGKRLLLSS